MQNINPDLFYPFIKVLLEVNKDINLISREVKPEEVFAKHINDSVKITDFFDFSNVKTLLDIGSGGGLPGIPLAIELPHVQVTLLDSTEKKMRAAQKIADDMKLKNVTVISGRTEELGHNQTLRGNFDIVTARAVAELPVILEYALPFVKIGGYFVAYKGKNYQAELSESKKAMDTLSAKLANIYTYELPDNLGERVYIVYKKISGTPKNYPRNIGVPKKTPLKS